MHDISNGVFSKDTKIIDMTVEELRNILGMMPPDKEVLIQQVGGDYDYMPTAKVEEKRVEDWSEFAEEDSWNEFVVIDF